MSQLVDAKLIKNLANTLELKDASTDACRLILSDVELKLRNVIKESIKYMRHFNREKMTNDDINCALKDLGQETKPVVQLAHCSAVQCHQVDELQSIIRARTMYTLPQLATLCENLT